MPRVTGPQTWFSGDFPKKEGTLICRGAGQMGKRSKAFVHFSIHQSTFSLACWCFFDFFFFFFFLSAKNASVMGSKQEPLSPPRLQDLLDLDPSLAPHAQTITNRLECACVSLIPSHDRERQAHMHTHAHTHAHMHTHAHTCTHTCTLSGMIGMNDSREKLKSTKVASRSLPSATNVLDSTQVSKGSSTRNGRQPQRRCRSPAISAAGTVTSTLPPATTLACGQLSFQTRQTGPLAFQRAPLSRCVHFAVFVKVCMHTKALSSGTVRVLKCVYMCVHVCACVCLCVHVCACVCARALMRAFAVCGWFSLA